MAQCSESRPGQASVERRQDIRLIVSLPGRYLLPKRRAAGGRRSEYACRLVNISPNGMVLAGPVIGSPGEPVISYFEEFGKLRGLVLRTLYGGFAMNIVATPAQRAQLETKLVWLEQHQHDDSQNARRHKRIVPLNPHSTLILADGAMLPCFVIDMSASGAAVSADVRPPVGMPLAIGKIVGRVVRRFAEGFAVHFVNAQDPQFLEQLLIKPFTPAPDEPEGVALGDIIAIDVAPKSAPAPRRGR